MASQFYMLYRTLYDDDSSLQLCKGTEPTKGTEPMEFETEQGRSTRSHYRDKEGKHRSVRWGSLKTIQTPQSLYVYDTKLRLYAYDKKKLGAIPFSVYTALLASHTSLPQGARTTRDGEIVVYRTRKELQDLTGYTEFDVSRAIKKLIASNYISRNTSEWDGRTRSQADSYVLVNPATAEVILAENKHKMRYFTYPLVVLTESDKRWSQAKMSGSAFLLYQGALFLANKYRGNTFTPKDEELLAASGLCLKTFKPCFEQLQDLGLIFVDGNEISICDPYTGLPLIEMDGVDEHNPANYYTADKGRERRLDINIDLTDPEAVKDFLFNTLGYDKPFVLYEGHIDICCPWHGDSKPSLSVALEKKGCWYCHKPTCPGPGKGWFLELCAGFGNVTFRPPDSKAVAIYSYRDEHANLLYQVLRYPNKPNGEKHFSTRQGDTGDYRWDRKDMPRTLFNRHLVKWVDTVVICEGEKDATTITELWPDKMVGTTSGSANSWNDAYTKFLIQKRCIVMTDADEDGQKYQADIVASLDAANIEYRVVSIGDLGCKDVTEYVEKHSNDPAFPEELVRHMGTDWVDMPDGSILERTFEPNQTIHELDGAVEL